MEHLSIFQRRTESQPRRLSAPNVLLFEGHRELTGTRLPVIPVWNPCLQDPGDVLAMTFQYTDSHTL